MIVAGWQELLLVSLALFGALADAQQETEAAATTFSSQSPSPIVNIVGMFVFPNSFFFNFSFRWKFRSNNKKKKFLRNYSFLFRFFLALVLPHFPNSFPNFDTEARGCLFSRTYLRSLQLCNFSAITASSTSWLILC